MREQLVLLLQLQKTDIRVRELQSAVALLPARLDPLRKDLAKLQGMLDGERNKLTETNDWRKAQQDHIDRERDQLKQAQNKFQSSKNTKEFNASSREVENKRKAISDREVELKKVNEVAAQSSAQLENRDKDVEAVRSELLASEAQLTEQLENLQAELITATAERDDARKQVDIPLIKVYDSLVAKRGLAVAAVIKGVCRGCHMALPPQLNNILARMQSIETCPRCGRLIYRQELLDGTPIETAPPVEEPKPTKPPRKTKPKAKKADKPPAPAPEPEPEAEPESEPEPE